MVERVQFAIVNATYIIGAAFVAGMLLSQRAGALSAPVGTTTNTPLIVVSDSVLHAAVLRHAVVTPPASHAA